LRRRVAWRILRGMTLKERAAAFVRRLGSNGDDPGDDRRTAEIEALLAEAVKDEREACAQEAATVLREQDGGSIGAYVAEQVLTAIRAREPALLDEGPRSERGGQ
jgi:hypothetical protein